MWKERFHYKNIPFAALKRLASKILWFLTQADGRLLEEIISVNIFYPFKNCFLWLTLLTLLLIICCFCFVILRKKFYQKPFCSFMNLTAIISLNFLLSYLISRSLIVGWSCVNLSVFFPVILFWVKLMALKWILLPLGGWRSAYLLPGHWFWLLF